MGESDPDRPDATEWERVYHEVVCSGSDPLDRYAGNPYFAATVVASERCGISLREDVKEVFSEAASNVAKWAGRERLDNLMAAFRVCAMRAAVDWARHDETQAHGLKHRAATRVTEDGEVLDQIEELPDDEDGPETKVVRQGEIAPVDEALRCLADDEKAPFGKRGSLERRLLRLGSLVLIDSSVLYEVMRATTEKDKSAWSSVSHVVRKKLGPAIDARLAHDTASGVTSAVTKAFGHRLA